MYKEHDAVKTPENVDAKIWRFMGLGKFISVLHKKALFFARPDKMKDKDSYECLPSRASIEQHYRVGGPR